ncbi:hypothetical protein DFJ73DRAFT_855087 [Zopfochytrium polystomum]|nr:hypothetical protein DFJ73DRAFT_855087 [Zopfochytrium polystomum]
MGRPVDPAPRDTAAAAHIPTRRQGPPHAPPPPPGLSGAAAPAPAAVPSDHHQLPSSSSTGTSVSSAAEAAEARGHHAPGFYLSAHPSLFISPDHPSTPMSPLPTAAADSLLLAPRLESPSRRPLALSSLSHLMPSAAPPLRMNPFEDSGPSPTARHFWSRQRTFPHPEETDGEKDDVTPPTTRPSSPVPPSLAFAPPALQSAVSSTPLAGTPFFSSRRPLPTPPAVWSDDEPALPHTRPSVSEVELFSGAPPASFGGLLNVRPSIDTRPIGYQESALRQPPSTPTSSVADPLSPSILQNFNAMLDLVRTSSSSVSAGITEAIPSTVPPHLLIPYLPFSLTGSSGGSRAHRQQQPFRSRYDILMHRGSQRSPQFGRQQDGQSAQPTFSAPPPPQPHVHSAHPRNRAEGAPASSQFNILQSLRPELAVTFLAGFRSKVAELEREIYDIDGDVDWVGNSVAARLRREAAFTTVRSVSSLAPSGSRWPPAASPLSQPFPVENACPVGDTLQPGPQSVSQPVTHQSASRTSSSSAAGASSGGVWSCCSRYVARSGEQFCSPFDFDPATGRPRSAEWQVQWLFQRHSDLKAMVREVRDLEAASNVVGMEIGRGFVER